MVLVEIEVDDDEDLIRIFTRFPNQTWSLGKLGPKDFCRIMHSHSGISLWRLNLISHEEAMNRMDAGEKLKGTAVTKAGRLKDLGFRFFGNGPNDPHLSVRCPGCNLSINYSQLCEPSDGSVCSFALHAPTSYAKTLSRNNIFVIARQIG
jgi:hypothetical protein